jgi:hypothetical protein
LANSIISPYHVDFSPLGDREKLLVLECLGLDFTSVEFGNDRWLSCVVHGPKGVAVVIIYEFKTPFDAWATVLVQDPKGLSRKLLTTMFRAVFSSAARITVHIAPDNQLALQQVWRMGFRYEGYSRRGYDGRRDAVVFGLLPEDCPYLGDEPFRMRLVTPTHQQPMGVQ